MNWQKQSLLCQQEWSRILCSWKRFKKNDMDLIKTYIGIGMFGFTEAVDSECLSLRSYHKNYTSTQFSRIQKIIDKLVSNDDEFTIGHTYLYLSENSVVYCVFRCRTKTNVIFIEPTGRVYNSWNHFLETNSLPSCKFLAPKNGVYGKAVPIVCYESLSSKELLGKSQNVMDWVCAMAGIGCTLLGVLSIAPGVAASTAIAIGMRNLHKSLANIMDQKEHQQLNALSTLNNSISLASIGTSALTTVSKSYEMLSLVGEQSGLALKIIQNLNIPNNLIDSGSFGTYLLHMYYRLQKGKISNIDVMELAAQIFILYGAVVDVLSLHRVITHEHINTRLDLAVKFNEWKRRLKKDCVRVKDCESLIALKLLSSRNDKISFQILRTFYTKDEVFLNTCFDMEHFTLDYLCERIYLNQFCVEMRPLFSNLWTLLREDFNSVKHILYQYLRFDCTSASISEHDCRDISKLLLNAVSVAKKIEIEIPSHEKKSLPNKSLETFSEFVTNRHKIMINVASTLITNYLYRSIDEVITACYKALLFTTDKINQMTNECYEEIVTYNRRIVGDERLPVILERIGVSTVDHYFHNDHAFSNVINKFKQAKHSIPDMIQVSDSLLSEQLIHEICKEIMMLYDEVYARVTNSLQYTIHETINVLQNISFLVNEKLIFEMELIRNQNSTYSQMNDILSFIGTDSAFNITEANELSILRKAKANVKIEEILSTFQSPNTVMEINPHTQKSDSQFCEALVIISYNFYQKIKDLFEEKNATSLIKKVFYFIIMKFIDTMNICSNDERAREVIMNMGRESKLIMAICASSESLFYAVLEKFDNDRYIDELVAQFCDFQYDGCWAFNKIPLYKEIIASNKFQLRCIKSSNHRDEEFFKLTASQLFDIDVNNDYNAVLNVNSVFLKSMKKFIIFNFFSDDDVMLVSSLDLKIIST